MKSSVVLSVGTMAALLWTSDGVAATITNRDGRDHKVTIMEGEARQEHTLKPEASLQGICQKGCIIRLNDSEDDDYELEGSEVVSIEDGNIYYDETDDPGNNPPASKGEPTPPPATK